MIIHIIFQCVANLSLLSHVRVNTLVITENQIVNRFFIYAKEIQKQECFS